MEEKRIDFKKFARQKGNKLQLIKSVLYLAIILILFLWVYKKMH